jgi:hypothetical protein
VLTETIRLGVLTLVGEPNGIHVHVSVLGAGHQGQRQLCGRFVTSPTEWASLRTLEAAIAEAVRQNAIVSKAKTIGRHWRDQQGVNAALLDDLANLTNVVPQ